MPLPVAGFPSRMVRISGGEVRVRGLSFNETQEAGEDFTVLALAAATGTPAEEVREWLGAVPAGDAKALMAAVVELSGLGEGAQFPGGSGDGAGDGGETVEG